KWFNKLIVCELLLWGGHELEFSPKCSNPSRDNSGPTIHTSFLSWGWTWKRESEVVLSGYVKCVSAAMQFQMMES
ncbi:hypothetical protein IRJ41_021975, partial [Triplophysa rosa]